MRISDWSSDVCSSDLQGQALVARRPSGNGQFGALRRPQRARRKAERQLAIRRQREVEAADQQGQQVLGHAERAQPLARRLLDPQGGIVAQAEARAVPCDLGLQRQMRSEEHTSELQSLMRISYAVFC